MSELQSLTAGDLRIDVENEATRLVLHWQGKSTDRHPGRVLEPFFAAVLAKAASQSAAVEMHFERLVHFNSSTIGCLIQTIGEAKAKGVKLILVFDRSLSWQRLSFEALNVFVKDNQFFELRPSGPGA